MTDEVEQPERADVRPRPLARWPVVVFGVLVLIASAIWMSCQEYASGRGGADATGMPVSTSVVESE